MKFSIAKLANLRFKSIRQFACEGLFLKGGQKLSKEVAAYAKSRPRAIARGRDSFCYSSNFHSLIGRMPVFSSTVYVTLILSPSPTKMIDSFASLNSTR